MCGGHVIVGPGERLWRRRELGRGWPGELYVWWSCRPGEPVSGCCVRGGEGSCWLSIIILYVVVVWMLETAHCQNICGGHRPG